MCRVKGIHLEQSGSQWSLYTSRLQAAPWEPGMDSSCFPGDLQYTNKTCSLIAYAHPSQPKSRERASVQHNQHKNTEHILTQIKGNRTAAGDMNITAQALWSQYWHDCQAKQTGKFEKCLKQTAKIALLDKL